LGHEAHGRSNAVEYLPEKMSRARRKLKPPAWRGGNKNVVSGESIEEETEAG